MAMFLNTKDVVDEDYDSTRRYHNDSSYIPSNIELMVDNSSMSVDMEQSLMPLSEAAKKSLDTRSQEEPFYDWKTKNKSFIRTYKDLHKKGIENNRFFLRLYDRGLQGVDVYAAIIPVDLQLRIILECFINPWYWLREVCRIPQDGTPIAPGGGVPYELDINNLACWYLFLNGIAHYQSKPRQCGKTQNALAEQNYAFHFGAMSATFLFFNKDQNLAKTNLYRFKTQRDLLPSWMQMRYVITEDHKQDKGIDNITSLMNPVTKNTIRVMPKAINEENANGIGRGYTAAFHHFDEVDFIPHQITIMDAASFSFSTASKNSWENGGLACRIFTSTPGDANSATGKAANAWVKNMLVWEDKFFDKKIDELIKAVNTPGKTPVVFVEHSWKQLKKSVKWYEEQCRLVSYKEEKILNEIELKRIAGNTLSPFKRSDLLYISRHLKEPINKLEFLDGFHPWFIYEDIHPDYPYIMAVDPAEGLNGDNSAITLINPFTLYPAAEFRCPFINPPVFAQMMIDFADEYCPKCMFVVESNKGRDIINKLMDSHYSEQVWYDADKINSKIVDVHDEYGAERQAAINRRALGFVTSPQSRPHLFGILENLMYEDKDKLCSQFLAEDVAGLIRKPSGRIEAGDGFHDDNIMSYLIGLRVYYTANNLEEFGIYRGMTEPIKETSTSKLARSISSLKEALPNLPENIRAIFSDFITEFNRDNAPKNIYNKGLQQSAKKSERMMRKEYGNMYMGFNPIEDDDNGVYHKNNRKDKYTDDDWDDLDQRIINSNFDTNHDVHIEDLF